MNSFYLLLYVPVLGLTVLWLLGMVKLFQGYRNLSREKFRKIGGALLGLALVTVSFAVMVITHARSFKLAMLLIVCTGTIDSLRNGFPRRKA